MPQGWHHSKNSVGHYSVSSWCERFQRDVEFSIQPHHSVEAYQNMRTREVYLAKLKRKIEVWKKYSRALSLHKIIMGTLNWFFIAVQKF